MFLRCENGIRSHIIFMTFIVIIICGMLLLLVTYLTQEYINIYNITP